MSDWSRDCTAKHSQSLLVMLASILEANRPAVDELCHLHDVALVAGNVDLPAVPIPTSRLKGPRFRGHKEDHLFCG